MSFKAMAWTWGQFLPPSQKIVLMGLANCHNDETGRCDPSIRYLARHTQLAERTVQYQIKALVEAGLIRVVQRVQRTSAYVLNLSKTIPIPEDCTLHGEDNEGANSAPGADCNTLRVQMAADLLSSNAPETVRETGIEKQVGHREAATPPPAPKKADPRGSRISEDWRPRQEEKDRAAELKVDWIGSGKAFLNHFLAKAGPDARKVNWDRAFQNWLERDAKYGDHPAPKTEPNFNDPKNYKWTGIGLL